MGAIALTKSVSISRPMQIYEGTLDITTVAVNTTSPVAQSFTVSGIKSTDMAVAFNCTDAGFILGIGNVRVTADNTIEIIFINPDDATVDPASTLNYRLMVIPG